MKLNLKWRKHPQHKNAIIGEAEELPDNKCWFIIAKLRDGNFWVMLPAMRMEEYDRRIIIREAETARDICEDFLNYNLVAIIQHQMREMKNTNLQPIKSPAYYDGLLQRYHKLIEEHKTPPRLAT